MPVRDQCHSASTWLGEIYSAVVEIFGDGDLEAQQGGVTGSVTGLKSGFYQAAEIAANPVTRGHVEQWMHHARKS